MINIDFQMLIFTHTFLNTKIKNCCYILLLYNNIKVFPSIQNK